MDTKLTIIVIGLAFIVTVRDYMLSAIDKGQSGSSLKTIQEACRIIKIKIEESKKNVCKKSKNLRSKKYHSLCLRSKQDTL